MAIIFAGIGAAIVIVYMAARMIAGWVVGRDSVARWDAGVMAVMGWIGKALLLITAGGIIYFVVSVYYAAK